MSDDPDAFLSRPTSQHVSSAGEGPIIPLSSQQAGYEERYNMTHSKRGLCIIINNRKFDSKTNMNERTGTDVDASNLYSTFKRVGFDVFLHNNKKTHEMIKLMSDASKCDHRDSDCLVVCLLSHGDEGVIYGVDGVVQIDLLTSFFKGDACSQLVGKPKVFLIQACRGSQLDHGVEVADSMDTEEKKKETIRLPSEADFLIAYSTVPGYFSWRNSTKGSWFVQAFVKVMEDHARTKDLLSIFTRTNRMVAYDFQSNASKEYMNNKKQIPSIVSMLTKDIYFS